MVKSTIKQAAAQVSAAKILTLIVLTRISKKLQVQKGLKN